MCRWGIVMTKHSSGTLNNRNHDSHKISGEKSYNRETRYQHTYHLRTPFTTSKRLHTLYFIALLLLLAIFLGTKRKEILMKGKLRYLIKNESQFSNIQSSAHIFGSIESDPVDRFVPFNEISLLIITILILGFGILLS